MFSFVYDIYTSVKYLCIFLLDRKYSGLSDQVLPEFQKRKRTKNDNKAISEKVLPWNQKKSQIIIYCNNCKYYWYLGSLCMLALDVA